MSRTRQEPTNNTTGLSKREKNNLSYLQEWEAMKEIKAISRCKLAFRVGDSRGVVSSNEIRGFSVNARLSNPTPSIFITCKYPSPTATAFPVLIIATTT
uniref:Uncharacterized protein n=1 Tax=Glycine max TaxID=3847 RepID=C6T3Y0_SOYBN|nr:unknown [Glycine max]